LNKILSFTGKTRKVLPPDYNIFFALVASFLITYVINPKTNLKINIGITIRDEVNYEAEMQTNFINFGLVTDLSNHYYDF